MNMPKLKPTQRWLVQGIVQPDAPKSADRLLRPSQTLQPAERLGIYRELYPARLVSALKTDYPLLCEHLGGPVFTQLALLYAQAHPSRAFTLNAFGQALPEFLTEVRGLKRAALVRDIALFERACTQSFHVPEAEPLTAEAIAAIPEAAWPKAKLDLHPAVRLLELHHPVWQLKQGERVHKRPSAVAVYRRNYDVQWLPLTPTAFAVLRALQAGKPLGKAIANARGPIERWFAEWCAAGLFIRIR